MLALVCVRLWCYVHRLHPLHNLWRVMSLLLLVGFLWKVIFLINAFMGGRLLHDRLSQSFVIRPSAASGW